MRVRIATSGFTQIDSCGSNADTRLTLFARCPLLGAPEVIRDDGDGATPEACGGGRRNRSATAAVSTTAAASGAAGFGGVLRSQLAAGDYWLMVSSDAEPRAPQASGAWQLRVSCARGGWPVPVRTTDRCDDRGAIDPLAPPVAAAGTPLATRDAAQTSETDVAGTESNEDAESEESVAETLRRRCTRCVARPTCGWCASERRCESGTAQGALLAPCAMWDPYGDDCALPVRAAGGGGGTPYAAPAREPAVGGGTAALVLGALVLSLGLCLWVRRPPADKQEDGTRRRTGPPRTRAAPTLL